VPQRRRSVQDRYGLQQRRQITYTIVRCKSVVALAGWVPWTKIIPTIQRALRQGRWPARNWGQCHRRGRTQRLGRSQDQCLGQFRIQSQSLFVGRRPRAAMTLPSPVATRPRPQRPTPSQAAMTALRTPCAPISSAAKRAAGPIRRF